MLGSVARDDHDGCIDSRLGSSVRGNASFGTVAGISEPVAHKLPGAGSSFLSFKGFSSTAGTAACTDSHRQHVCGFIEGKTNCSVFNNPSCYSINAPVKINTWCTQHCHENNYKENKEFGNIFFYYIFQNVTSL